RLLPAALPTCALHDALPIWRAAVRLSGAKKGDAVLDCATGTGDLAIAFKKRVQDGRVVGTDFVPEMIELARKKSPRIEFEVADRSEEHTSELQSQSNLVCRL